MDCDDLAGSAKTIAAVVWSAFPIWGCFLLIMFVVWLLERALV